jgi:hypothetical protein
MAAMGATVVTAAIATAAALAGTIRRSGAGSPTDRDDAGCGGRNRTSCAIPQARPLILSPRGMFLGARQIDIAAFIEPFGRTEGLRNRIDEQPVAINSVARAGAARPKFMSGHGITMHRVENLNIVRHMDSAAIGRRRYSRRRKAQENEAASRRIRGTIVCRKSHTSLETASRELSAIRPDLCLGNPT